MQQTIQEELIKLQPKGLITIPKKFRVALGFEEQGIIRITKEKGRLIMEPVRTLPYPVRSYTTKEIKDFLDFDDKETNELKKKKLL